MNTLGSNQDDIMIPLEDAFFRLRSYSEKREDRIKLIKIGKLTVYFELSPEIVLKVPLPYWQAKGMRNFKFADPVSDRADTTSVSRILPYYVNILDRAKRALESSDLTALCQIPEIEFWSRQFVENGDIQPDWKAAIMALDKLTYALLSNAPKKVNLFVWDKDIAKYCDLSLNTPINKAGRPRIPTPDEFWIAMLKSLQIQKFASKQDAVIAELNGWVKQQGNLENITSSLVKDRVGQVWKAADLARINRDGK